MIPKDPDRIETVEDLLAEEEAWIELERQLDREREWEGNRRPVARHEENANGD